MYQDDNAPPHRARITAEWFEKYGITRLPWPSKSPDINIIEDVWSHIKYHLRGRIFETEEELWEELRNQWNGISQEWIRRLYDSLPARIEAVIAAEGGNTKY
jgi:transposase